MERWSRRNNLPHICGYRALSSPGISSLYWRSIVYPIFLRKFTAINFLPHLLFHLFFASATAFSSSSSFVKYRTSSSSSLPTRHSNRLQFLIKIWFKMLFGCSFNFSHSSTCAQKTLWCTREASEYGMIECRCDSVVMESEIRTKLLLRLRATRKNNENKILN